MLESYDLGRIQDTRELLVTTAGVARGWTCTTMADFRAGVLMSPNLRQKEIVGLECFFAVLTARCGPLAQAPADHRVIRSVIDEVNEDRCGGQPHRAWRRMRQTLTAGLRSSGLERMPRRHEVNLLPDWQRSLTLIQNKTDRGVLRRFGSWCSMHGVGHRSVCRYDFPTFICDATETLECATSQASSRNHLRELLLELVKAWNRAVVAFPDDWPQLIVPRDLHRFWRTREMGLYPISLRDELDEMFQLRRECRNDVVSPWRASISGTNSERSLRYMIRGVLDDICNAARVGPSALTSLKEAFTAANIDKALMRRCERDENRASETRYGVAVEIRNIAKNYLMLQKSDIDGLSEIVKFHNPKISGRSESSRKRILWFENEVFIRRVTTVSERTLLEYASVKPASRKKAAREVLAVLAVDLGIKLALWPAHLVSLKFGRELLLDDTVVQFRGSGCFDAIDLPLATSNLLRLYLRLSGVQPTNGAWLFPGSKRGRHRSVAVLSRHIADVCEACGCRLTGRDLRDLSAFLRLQKAPGDVGGCADMLGHLSDAFIRDTFKFILERETVEESDNVLAAATRQRRKSSGGRP